jgi:hypothetical protein
VIHLTKKEQLVLCIVTALLITGLAVKGYRTAHPPIKASELAKP